MEGDPGGEQERAEGPHRPLDRHEAADPLTLFEPLPAAPLAGRYRLLAQIGAGTAGMVYRAEDVSTRAPVAVKILADTTPQRLRRFEREARALRLLGVRGVVRLLGEGEHLGRRFLVTELVDGAPFPGTAGVVPWSSLAPTALRFLEILARIHEAGVLHRDLKPANVLVDAAGLPTVLDFGLARVDGSESLTRTGDVLGTPRYQAPEQILGDHPVDARTDLYAAGVMLYEALAGRPPQPPRSVGRVYAARLVRDAPPLRTVAPDVPVAVADVIDRMVARAPEDRPGSARTVLAALGGSAPPRLASELPWLGPARCRDRVGDVLRAGGTVTIVGVRGSGRSRLLREVEALLAGEGRTCIRLPPGERPLESLSAALGVSFDGEDAGTAALGAAVAAGAVVLADDAARVDPWSAGCVAATRAPCASTWVPGEEAAEITLAPLDVESLAALFPGGGPEARAAATLLAARTGGLPARVAAEVGRWIADGHAAWAGERLRLAPEARWLLAMGPPADVRPGRRECVLLSEPLARTLGTVALAEPWATPRAIAAAHGEPRWQIEAELRELVERGLVERLPEGALRVRPDVAGVDGWSASTRRDVLLALAGGADDATGVGAPGAGVSVRLARLLAAEAWPEAADEAGRVATGALARGEPGRAWGAASWGLKAALEGDGHLDARAGTLVDVLVDTLVRAGLALGTPGALRGAATLIAQVAAHAPAPDDHPHADPLLATRDGLLVLAAGLEGTDGGPPPPLTGPHLAVAREELVFERLLATDPASAAAWLDTYHDAPAIPEEATASRPHPSRPPPPGRTCRLAMEARLRLAVGRAHEAVALLERALREDVPALGRPRLRVLLADALLEAGALTEAERAAAAAGEDAAARGFIREAGLAAAILRDAQVRAGGAPTPAVVVDAEILGMGPLTARVCLTEAAAAWRASSYEEAVRLARRAVAADGSGGPVPVLARALELACDIDALPTACSDVLAAADRLHDPALSLQVRGLVALAAPARAAALLPEVEALAGLAGGLGEARAVLSGGEAVAFCRARARRTTRTT